MNAAHSMYSGAACPAEMQLPFQCWTTREALDRAGMDRETGVMKSREKVFRRKLRIAFKHRITNHSRQRVMRCFHFWKTTPRLLHIMGIHARPTNHFYKTS